MSMQSHLMSTESRRQTLQNESVLSVSVSVLFLFSCLFFFWRDSVTCQQHVLFVLNHCSTLHTQDVLQYLFIQRMCIARAYWFINIFKEKSFLGWISCWIYALVQATTIFDPAWRMIANLTTLWSKTSQISLASSYQTLTKTPAQLSAGSPHNTAQLLLLTVVHSPNGCRACRFIIIKPWSFYMPMNINFNLTSLEGSIRIRIYYYFI